MSRGGRGGSRNNSKAILESLGLQKGDIVGDKAQSPIETFPPLPFPPPQPKQHETPQEKYPLMVKKEVIEYFQNSQYYIRPDKTIKSIEHYSDKYLALLNVSKPLELDWSRLPQELKPTVKTTKKTVKRKTAVEVKPNIIKRRKTKEGENLSEKLEELEKKESKTGADSEPEEGVQSKEEEEEVEEIEEEQDEEMDEGTDYIQSYFDNGESYLDDDDDALEDEGIM